MRIENFRDRQTDTQRETDRQILTALHGFLTDVADEIFTEEIIPQSLVDEACAVLSSLMPVAPVVWLARLPLPTITQQRALTH